MVCHHPRHEPAVRLSALVAGRQREKKQGGSGIQDIRKRPLDLVGTVAFLASPFGRGGIACDDGEGKPSVSEPLHSDKQTL